MFRSDDFYNFQVAIPGPFEEKPVVDWGFSLRLCDLVRHVCIPCCYMMFVSMQFLFLLHILNLPVYLRVWFCTVLWWHEDGETLMPKATRTRSSQFRRRRLIGVIFLSEARPFRGFLAVTTGVAIRNPQSNQVQFVWTFYRSSLPPLWTRGDQVSCGSKCSKVEISEKHLQSAAFWSSLRAHILFPRPKLEMPKGTSFLGYERRQGQPGTTRTTLEMS